jgi:hypothetical protein
MFSLSRSVLCATLVVSAIAVQQSCVSQAQSTPAQPAEPAEMAPVSSSPAAPSASSAQTAPAQASTTPANSLSVQARIRARREQRRTAAIHDVYGHLYEVYIGGGYLRAHAGPDLQKVTEYSWDIGVTRYYNQHLGVTVDGRGMYGSPFVGLNSTVNGAITNPAVSQYAVLGGPTYRFLLHPKYSVAGRVMGGYERGNFSGDLNGFTPTSLGLYPDSSTFAISAAAIGEVNISPELGIRLAPEYFATGFNSSIQNNLGFTAGVVYRFGKQ